MSDALEYLELVTLECARQADFIEDNHYWRCGICAIQKEHAAMSVELWDQFVLHRHRMVDFGLSTTWLDPRLFPNAFSC